MNNIIAVSIGDINGIGIEILIKLFKGKKIKKFVLFTNIKILKKYLLKNNYKFNINQVNLNKRKFIYKNNCLNIFSFNSLSNEENTINAIKFSHKECKNKRYIGLVTLPIRKDLIIKKVLPNFIGHTEYLQNLEKKKYSNMILYHKNIIVSPITTHIPIISVSKKIKNKNLLFNQIINLNLSLKRDFNIKNPKLVLSGINPHAGEMGKIGDEELKFIIPIVKKLKLKKINISGPLSADSMLISSNLKKYDCFIFIFHDQALIPFKFISNFSGVNFTGNLEIIRTSPDHGTAYKLKGTNNISTISLENSFKLVKEINKNRIFYDKTKKIFKSKLFNR